MDRIRSLTGELFVMEGGRFRNSGPSLLTMLRGRKPAWPAGVQGTEIRLLESPATDYKLAASSPQVSVSRRRDTLFNPARGMAPEAAERENGSFPPFR